MGDRSGCMIIILILLLLTNIAGFYLFIDSNSRFTVAVADNSEKLNNLSNNIENLKDQIANLKIAPTLPVTNVETGNATDFSTFANSEFRPANAVSGGIITQAISTFSGNLNSLIRSEATTSTIESSCNDSLAVRNLMNPEEYQPKLAEYWQISPDGLTYTIKIKEGVTWHPYTDPITREKIAAKEVTADDFIFFWDTINNQEIPCDPIRTYFKLVKNIEKIDRYTFKIIWKEPYALSRGISLTLTPLPRHYYRPDPNWTDSEFAAQMITSKRNQFLIGCGPYYLDRWIKGQSLTLKRYEGYYGPKPYIKEIRYKVMPESNIQLVELKKGGIDLMGLTPEQWVKETNSSEFKTVTPSIETAIADSQAWNKLKEAGKTPKNYQLEKFQYESAATSWFFIAYNQQDPMFQDKDVRTALTMLTDRSRIMQDVRFNFGKIIAGPFVGASPYIDPAVKPYEFDPAKARELLARSGWTDTDNDGLLDKDLDGDGKREPFEYSLIIPNTGTTARQIGAIVQANLKSAGIQLDLTPIEWSAFIDKLDNKAFDACILGWTGVLDPDPYQVWHSSQAGKKQSSNFISFKNPEADRLIEEARRSTDPEKRKKLLREFYRLIHEQQPYTFLYSDIKLRAQNKKYYNNVVYRLGMDDDFVWIPQKLQ